VATLLVSAGLVVTWARSGVLTVAALVAFPLGLATCCLMARAATSAFAAFLASRRFREFAFVVLGLVTAGFAIGVNLLTNGAVQSGGRYREALTDAAQIFGWTPFGWAWSVPAEVARGQWLLAGVRLVLALGLVAVLWLTWGHFLALRLVEPVDAGGAAAKVRPGTLVERLYPGTPAGAVAERTLRYWRRDPRYLAGVIGILIAPAVVLVTQLVNPNGPPLLAAFTSVILAGLIGISVAADLSYDGTAVWLHISAGLSGADDRAGRVLSALTIFGPLLVVLSLVSLALTGQWRLWLPVTALTVGLTLISLGAGAYVGALWQWPAPPPGANPFQSGSSGGLPSFLSFLLTTTATVVLSLPTVALVVASFWWPWLGLLALVVGLVSGLGVLKAGIGRGGKLLDRRWPEVLASVSQSAG
jgi:ABC-2 type transport system permease protein